MGLVFHCYLGRAGWQQCPHWILTAKGEELGPHSFPRVPGTLYPHTSLASGLVISNPLPEMAVSHRAGSKSVTSVCPLPLDGAVSSNIPTIRRN